MEFVPWISFPRIVARHAGDTRVSTLRAAKRFRVMAYAQLTWRKSLRVQDIWWDERKGGTGAGYNINGILPIQPAPLVGMQGWYDTVRTIRKVS